MMNKIDKIWAELENDTSFQSGVLIRRYSAQIQHDIYVALSARQRQRCLAVSLSNQINISSWNTLQDIRFEVIPNPQKADTQLLLLILADINHKDIFSVLCEDLLLSVTEIKDENKLIQTLLNRLAKWENLFEKVRNEGLSIEEQKGLFGELYFLRQFLQQNTNHQLCIDSWTGPDANARDFQLDNWAVEVKSTTAVNPQKIPISNERQLDTSQIQNLFLVHLGFEGIKQSNETLNQIISEIRSLLESEQRVLQKFNLLLYEAGYFPTHLEFYNAIGYRLRHLTYYKIAEGFPRIAEISLPNGVSDVKYSIQTAACSTFEVNPVELFNTINNEPIN
jgi:hypothetical protein